MSPVNERRLDVASDNAQVPIVLISASTEDLPIVGALRSLLEPDVRCVRYDSEYGESPGQAVTRALQSCDFAITVLPDDELVGRPGRRLQGNNVLFELGFVVAALGRNRCFVLASEKTIHLPTDLAGILIVQFPVFDESEVDDYEQILRPAAEHIRMAIRRLGRRPRPDSSAAKSDTTADALASLATADPGNIQQVAAAHLELSTSYYESVLTQARQSFRSALFATVIGSLFFIGAIGFAIVSGKLVVPIISSIGGTLIEVIAGLNFWLYSRTSEQLSSFHIRLEQAQRLLLANSMCEQLTSADNRDDARKELIQVAGIVRLPETQPLPK